MKESTASIKTIGGFPIVIPNIASGWRYRDNFTRWYISYNNRDRHIYGSDTTALVIENKKQTNIEKLNELKNAFVWEGDNFYILNGDHVEKFSSCHLLEECIDYFVSQIEYVSKISQDIQGWIIFDSESKQNPAPVNNK